LAAKKKKKAKGKGKRKSQKGGKEASAVAMGEEKAIWGTERLRFFSNDRGSDREGFGHSTPTEKRPKGGVRKNRTFVSPVRTKKCKS